MDYGKKFEEKFRQDWEKTTGGIIVRLYDNVSGFLNISNVSDFICYKYPYILFIECKTHKGASIPFTSISQYDKLLRYKNIQGVKAGVVLWLYEKDKVFYIPIETMEQLKNEDEKSIGIRHLGKYDIIEIPSKKLRTFMDSDYSVLLED